jgi:hypothetical protein
MKSSVTELLGAVGYFILQKPQFVWCLMSGKIGILQKTVQTLGGVAAEVNVEVPLPFTS